MGMKIIEREAKVWYLRRTIDSELGSQSNDLVFKKFDGQNIDLYVEVYKRIGGPWNWTNRLLISRNELDVILKSNSTVIYFLLEDGLEIGLLEMQIENSTMELVYFGLDVNYMRKGFGKLMMKKAFSEAKSRGVNTIWLHTCEFDSPSALKFYLSSGFEIYDEKIEIERHLDE